MGDGDEVCRHAMDPELTIDTSKFINAPMRFGGYYDPDNRNMHAQLNNIKLVGDIYYNRLLGGNNNNDNRRHLQEGDTTVAAFDVAATLNKADDGPVALQQTPGGSITTGTSTLQALRHLQPITGLDPSGAGGGAEELLEGLFELNIEMDIPSNESSAPLSSSMTTTVAVIALGSILFVVSSMIY